MMALTPLAIPAEYWQQFKIADRDLDFLYNALLEKEIPLSTTELTSLLVDARIDHEINRLKSQSADSQKTYLPKNDYKIGQKVVFPSLDMREGKVAKVRDGKNPEYPGLKVIQVEFSDAVSAEFAANIENHELNLPTPINFEDPTFSSAHVLDLYGREISHILESTLDTNLDLVRIAGRWFPRSLLVDVSQGNLNLAEAVLEVNGGGPLTTRALLEQIELPTDSNQNLTEFSMNLALQEDERFDEVGPAGETLWFLKRLEPDDVQNPPYYLKFARPDYDYDKIAPLLRSLESVVTDELEPELERNDSNEHIQLSLIFPHWRSGTLPLSSRMLNFFPTAYEAPRVQFTFVDEDTAERFSGWVVRPYKYVYGLAEWYESRGVIPGSIIHIKKSKVPGEVLVKVDRRKPSKDWLRTLLIGADGGFVFAMMKQGITTSFDERMTIILPDLALIDKLWAASTRYRGSLEDLIKLCVRELSKLNPQGHVHLQELYAGVNLIKRCPPGLILHSLLLAPWAGHMGDLYFRINDDSEG